MFKLTFCNIDPNGSPLKVFNSDDKLPQVWGDRDSRHLQDWMEIWLCTRDELRMTIWLHSGTVYYLPLLNSVFFFTPVCSEIIFLIMCTAILAGLKGGKDSMTHNFLWLWPVNPSLIASFWILESSLPS